MSEPGRSRLSILRAFSIVLSICLVCYGLLAIVTDEPARRFGHLAVAAVFLLNTGMLLWEQRKRRHERRSNDG